ASVSAMASIGTSGVKTGFQISFTATGPGIELIGLGAGTASPVDIDLSGWQSKLSSIVMDGVVDVNHQNGSPGVKVHPLPPRRAASTRGGATYAVDLAGSTFSASRADLGQNLTLNNAQLRFEAGQSVLDGTVLVSSASAKFSFQMLFSFPASAKADIV